MILLFFIGVAGYLLYRMPADDRTQLFERARDLAGQVKETVQSRMKNDPFRTALRARTPWAVVTPALVALNVTIFIMMLLGRGELGDPDTLVAWGGNFAPRTTNNEWWRLVAAMFVHSGRLHLLVNMAALLQIGFLLERLHGGFAVATVYLAAGVFANLLTTSTNPMAVSVGASGALCGLYGMLAVTLMFGMLRASPVRIPLNALKRLGPPMAMFVLYHVLTSGDHSLLAGFITGVAGGAALATAVTYGQPSARRVGVTLAAAVVIAVACAVPLHGIPDIRPELARVVAVEDRTAAAYQTAVERFKSGRTTAEALAQLIRRTIMPELQATRLRLNALERVPDVHQPLVTSAQEYLRLRDESWRMRADGLDKGSMGRLREADQTERASLQALQQIRTTDQK